MKHQISGRHSFSTLAGATRAAWVAAAFVCLGGAVARAQPANNPKTYQSAEHKITFKFPAALKEGGSVPAGAAVMLVPAAGDEVAVGAMPQRILLLVLAAADVDESKPEVVKAFFDGIEKTLGETMKDMKPIDTAAASVATAPARRTTAKGTINGMQVTMCNVYALHAGKVYVFESLSSPDEANKVRANLDQITASVEWQK